MMCLLYFVLMYRRLRYNEEIDIIGYQKSKEKK